MAKSVTGAKKSAKKPAKEKKPRKKGASSTGAKGVSKKTLKQSGAQIAENTALDLEIIPSTYAEEAWSDHMDQIAADLPQSDLSAKPASVFGIKSKSGIVVLMLGVALATFALTTYWAGLRPSFWDQEVGGNRTLAAVNPADFWQQRPQASMKGDYNGEITEAAELQPFVDDSADSDTEATPAEIVAPQSNSYPSIEAGGLPYDPEKVAVAGSAVGPASDPSKITDISKTPPAEPVDETFTLAEGESLARRLVALGVTPEAARSLAASIEPVFPGQLMKAGMTFDVTLDKQQDFYGNNVIFPVRLSFQPGPNEEILVESDEYGQFNARIAGADEGTRSRYAEYPQIRAKSKVGSSLYATARDEGIPVYIISEMIRIYSYDVDFETQVKASDEFEVFFGEPDPRSTFKGNVLLYAALEINGKMKRYYRYTIPGENQSDYFDEDGQSATKGLLRKPVSGAPITAGFGMRTDPLLGYPKMHTGIEFSAPMGTPIKAAGSGVIKKAGRADGLGNMVQIAHQGEYSTVYAHMSHIATGISPGTRVRQGEVIGYVGSSGRSSGPGLYYEIRVNDRPVNPLKVKVAGGRQLSGKQLSAFRQQQQKVIAMMKNAPLATQAAKNQ